MASLMENLISVLNKENSEYQRLLELSMKKTPIIVGGNLEALQKITDEEQEVLTQINHLDRKREEVILDIANVLNKDVASLKLDMIIQMLETRPLERNALAEIHDKLQDTISQMVRVNEQNRELITSSLELVEFDMNLIQSMKSAPETANYNRGAYNTGSVIGGERGSFDAKQ